MMPKFEDIQRWFHIAEIPESWLKWKWIARVLIIFFLFVLLAQVIVLIKDILGPKEVNNPVAHAALIKPSIEDAPRTSINGSNSELPCGNPGDYRPNNDAHQREAWNLLEKTLEEMQRQKKKDTIDMRLIESARHDWDMDHTREALLKFRAALGCNSVSKDREARE